MRRPLLNGRGGAPAQAAPAVHAAPHFAAPRSGGGMPHFSGRMSAHRISPREAAERVSRRVNSPRRISPRIDRCSRDTTRFRSVTSNAHPAHDRTRTKSAPRSDAPSPIPIPRAAGVTSHRRRTRNPHLRRNGTAAITAQAARQGRFGSRFAGADGQSFRECRRAPGLAARPARRLRAVVRAGVLALRLFRHFRLRVLALRL